IPVLLLVVVLAGCKRAEPAEPPSQFERQGDLVVIPEQSILRDRLKFDTARVEKIQSQLSAPAVVEADPQQYANIFPPLTGRLIRLHVQLGDTVTNGQLLASLQSPDFFAAQDNYVKAKSIEELTNRALKRQQELLENKIAAQKDVEQAMSDYESAKIDLDTAVEQLLAYGFNPDTDKFGQPMQVFSPLSGQVVEMASAHGEFRNDNTIPLMTVADLSTVWVTASVHEKDLRFLTKGQEISASIAAYPGESFSGKVSFIGDLIDPDIRVAKVRIAFDNPDRRLKPGMFATVNFLGFPQTQVTVPATAVVQSGNSAFIFEQIKPWILQPREVKVGTQQDDRLIITDGLEAGASILAKEGVLFQ
ncbi:MAG: efflux RND transporter periplasmic adaptor subunit, partial [Verrucomicrobiota bacterium]